MAIKTLGELAEDVNGLVFGDSGIKIRSGFD